MWSLPISAVAAIIYESIHSGAVKGSVDSDGALVVPAAGAAMVHVVFSVFQYTLALDCTVRLEVLRTEHTCKNKNTAINANPSSLRSALRLACLPPKSTFCCLVGAGGGGTGRRLFALLLR